MTAPPKIENRRKGGWIRGLLRFFVFCVLSGSLIGGAVLGSVYVHYSEQLPPLPDMVVVPPSEVGVIHATDGQILGRYSKTWRTPFLTRRFQGLCCLPSSPRKMRVSLAIRASTFGEFCEQPSGMCVQEGWLRAEVPSPSNWPSHSSVQKNLRPKDQGSSPICSD